MKSLRKKYVSLSKAVRNSRIIALIGFLAVPYPFVFNMDLFKGGLAISLVGLFLLIGGVISWIILRNNRSAARGMLDSNSVFAEWIIGDKEVVLSKRGIFYNDEILQCDAYSDFFLDANLTMDNKLIITDSHVATYYARHKQILTIDVPEEYLAQAAMAAEFYRKSRLERL